MIMRPGGLVYHSVITKMYKTPCCNIEVPWNKARSSRPLWPVKCSNCGKEYHDGTTRKWIWFYILIVIIIFPITAYFDIIDGTKNYIYILPGSLSILIVISIFEEYSIVKKGILVQTNSDHKKKNKRQLYIFGIFIFLLLAYESYKAL